MRESDDKTIKVQRSLESAHRIANRPTRKGLDLASRLAKADEEKRAAEASYKSDPNNTMLAERLDARTKAYDEANTSSIRYRDQESLLNEQRIRGAIGQSTSNAAMRGDVAGFKSLPDVQMAGMRLASRSSYDPYRTRAGARNQITKLQDQFEMIDPDEDEASKRSQRLAIGRTINKHTRTIAEADIAISERGKEGSSVSALLRNAQKISENEANRQSANSRAQGVASGQYGTIEAMEANQGRSAQLIEANRKLLLSMEETAEGYNTLATTLRTQEKAYKENEKILKEMARQGGGGGGWGGAVKTMTPYIQSSLSALGGMNSASVQDAQLTIQRRIDQPLERMQLGSRFAALTNDAYDITKRAKGGDIHAIMQAAVLSKSSSLAGEQGVIMHNLQRDIKAGVHRGGAIDTTAGAINDAATTLVATKGNITMAGGAAATTIGSGVWSGLSGQKTMSQGLKLHLAQGGTAASYEEGRRQYAGIVTEIDARQVSNAIDYRVGSASGYRGTGGVAGDKPLRAQRAADLELSQLGMDGAEQARLAQALQRSMGSKAVESGPGGMAAVSIQRRGGQLAQAGVIESAGQYAGWAGAMAGIGGDQRDVEGAMARAVKSGLESAKTIEQMVTGIVSLSERDARSGINTSQGAGAMLERGVAGMLSRGFDVNTATEGAKTGADLINKMGSGNRADMSAVYGMKNFLRQGATMAQASTMSIMTPQMMESIVEGASSKDEKARANALALAKASGLESFLYNDGQYQVSRGRQMLGTKKATPAAPLMAINPDAWREVDAAAKAGGDMTKLSQKTRDAMMLTGTLIAGDVGQGIAFGAAFTGGQVKPGTSLADRVNKNSEFKLANQVGAARGAADAAERKVAEDRGQLVPNMMNVVRDNSTRPGSQDLGRFNSSDAANAAEKLTLNAGVMSKAMSGFASQLSLTAGRFEALVTKIDAVLDKESTGTSMGKKFTDPVAAVGKAVGSGAAAVGRALGGSGSDAVLDGKLGSN